MRKIPKETKIKKETRLFQGYDLHADDSSDEEISKNTYDSYNYIESWNDFCEENEDHRQDIDYLLSFCVHAYGIQLQHHSNVRDFYYQHKQTSLAQDVTSKNEELVYSQLVKLLEGSFYNVTDLLFCGDVALSLEQEQQFLNSINKSLRAELCVVATNITKNARELGHKKVSVKGIIDINKLGRLLDDAIINTLNSLKFKVEQKDISNVSEQELEAIAGYLQKNVEETFKEWGIWDSKWMDARKNYFGYNADLKRIDRKNMEGKIQSALKFVNIFSNMEEVTGTLAYHLALTNGNTLVRNVVSPPERMAKKINWSNLAQIYLKEIVEVNDMVEPFQLIRRDIPSLLLYLPLKDKDVSNYVVDIFVNKLQTFKPMFSPRKTLPPSYTAICVSPYSFFANLRLSTRSQRRTIRNLSQMGVTSNPMMMGGLSVQRQWQFGENGPIVLEEQGITQNAKEGRYSRSDQVKNCGSYNGKKGLYEIINKSKNFLKQECNYEMTDSDLALWIRKTLCCENFSLPTEIEKYQHLLFQKLISSMTYLLFGCESSRNPAMLVVNQMLLDLIIQEDASWYAVFDGRRLVMPMLMPMVPEDAVAGARQLEALFEDYMPLPYHYEGKAEGNCTADEICEAEARIVKDWLKKKFGRDYDKKIEDDGEFDENEVMKFLLEKINTSCDGWFNISETTVTETSSFKPM